jgi:hypothetical protein
MCFLSMIFDFLLFFIFAKLRLWLVACGLWLVACGLWLVACLYQLKSFDFPFF